MVREILYKETSRNVEQIKILEKRGLVHTPKKMPKKRQLSSNLFGPTTPVGQAKDSEEYYQDRVFREMSRRSTGIKLSAIDILINKDIKDSARDRQENTDNFSFAMLMTFNIIIACLPMGKLPEYIANIAGSTTVPFLQFMLPGCLYFYFLSKVGIT